MPQLIDTSFKLPELPDDLDELDRSIKDHESAIGNIKPDNEARIVWNDGKKKKTRYAIVYLHGFTASQGEGYPVHRDIAKRYGCNLYLSRLYGHGIDKDAFHDLTKDKLIKSALYAFAAGCKIGEEVILMGTSTGASLAILLASQFKNIKGIIAYSPLIDFHEMKARMIDSTYFRYFLTRFFRFKYIHKTNNTTPEENQYWYTYYHINGLIALNDFIRTYMNAETYEKVTKPFFLGYYYHDKKEQDPTVSVTKMISMFRQLGTGYNRKKMINFRNAHAHVIGSQYTSEAYYEVRSETINFIEEYLGIKPL